VLCPHTVVVDVKIVEYVSLITRLDKQTSNVDETFHNLSTAYATPVQIHQFNKLYMSERQQ